jgi:quercetin dioxygenase-like cupin family protein
MFIVTSGHVRLEVDDKVVYLRTGNFQRIKALTKHRFLGLEESTIIEVSTQHFEDDSYRIEESKKVS